MTNPVVTMDERIERAKAALEQYEEDSAAWHGGLSNDEIVACVINAAYPELMDGSAWVAPTEATIGVYRPLLGRLKELYEKTDNQQGLEFVARWVLGGFAEDWATLRDAHQSAAETK